MKGLRIGKRRARKNGPPSSPLERALVPAFTDERWQIPDRFNFTRDVVEVLAGDPKRRALTFLGKDGIIEPRTFKQISDGATRWASILREDGVHPDDRVAVLAGSGLEWLEVILGVIKIGGVTVPCSPALSAAALEARISSTGAVLVIAEESCQPEISQMSFSPEVHYLNEGRHRRTAEVPDDEPTHDTASRDLAFIVSTPGASGEAKSVAHTHGSLFATRLEAEHWLDAGRGDSVWCTAPPESAHAVWNALVGPWSRGAEVVLHQGEFDPLERLDLLYRLSPSILCQSPDEYRALAELRELERFRSPRLRRLVSTGDYLEPEVISAFEERWGMTIHDGYGQAETNIVVANGADDGFKPGSLGRALPGHQVAIIDSEGSELPVGIEGDLAVRGRPPTLFAGYWESPDETKSAFRGDWYVTGDVAIADEDGFFWFVGRAEDIITSRGRTFGPYEVERALRDHGAIAASAAIGLRDLQRGGQFVRAYVVPRGGSEGTEQLEAELRQFVGQALPEQLVPREIVFVDELPVVGGKVSRHTLRERPVGGRPLWDLPPTSAPEAEEPPLTAPPVLPPPVVAEAEPVVVYEPPVAPAPAPAPIVVPEPVVAPEPPPETVAEIKPLRPPEPEAVVTPEPAVEWVVEPEVMPEPERVPEPVAEAAPELAQLPEPEAKPEPIEFREPEPVSEARPVAEPEPPVAPTPLPEPEAVPEPTPEPVAAEVEPTAPPLAEAPAPREPEPAPLPDFMLEPEPEPTPVELPEQEPVVSAAPEPLPDFVVPRDLTPARLPPPPEPEPEPDLGPLPDYIVDPNRPPDLEPSEPERAAASARPPLKIASEPDTEPTTPGLYFPPAASFPAPRDDPDEEERRRDAPKAPRRRPPPDSRKKRGRSGAAEPGDEAEEVSWMAGLSNRLSAYSLAGEDEDASESNPPGSDEPGDAKTGT